MKKLKNCFMNMKIERKMVICFFFATIALTVTLGFGFYIVISDVVLGKKIIQAEETIEQITTNIDYNIKMIDEKFFYLAFNPIVQSQLQTDITALTPSAQSAAKRQLGTYMIQAYNSASMEDLELIGAGGQIYYISIWDAKKNVPNEARLIEAARDNMGRLTIINNTAETNSIQVLRQVKDIVTMRPIGYLRTSIRLSDIYKATRNVDFGSHGTVIVLDENYQIVGNRDTSVGIDKALFEGWRGTSNYRFDGQEYTIVYSTVPDLQWKVVGVLPTEYLNQELKTLRVYIALFSVFSFLLALLLSRLLTRLIVQPINKMSESLERFSKGDFSVRLPENRKDEIGQMGSVFNQTISKVNYLLNEVSRAQLLEKEMEFKALQAQINPHFLYNTFDTINWMARKEGKENICNMITAIGNLMRISISNHENIITIENELKYVRDYLYIQQVRYRDRITASFSVDQRVIHQKIPKLTLQPLVENAVVHGIEGRRGKGEIHISCEKSGNDVLMVVKDTGVGISESILPKLLENLPMLENDKKSHTSLGLFAVNERIKYLYGDGYGLRLLSGENQGTTVEIRFPYQDDPLALSEKIKELYGERGNGWN